MRLLGFEGGVKKEFEDGYLYCSETFATFRYYSREWNLPNNSDAGRDENPGAARGARAPTGSALSLIEVFERVERLSSCLFTYNA